MNGNRLTVHVACSGLLQVSPAKERATSQNRAQEIARNHLYR